MNREKVVSHAIDTLQELKGITKVLRETSYNIDHNISEFESDAMPIIRQHGLTSLPQEILVHIRLLLHADCDKDPEIGASPKCPLQLVSRQFRHLELSIPQLWTHVDIGKMKADRIHLQLGRSGALGMSFDLSMGRYSSRSREFFDCVCDRLSIITQDSRRWTQCTLGVYDLAPLPGNRGEDHLCFATLENLALPSLKHLDTDFLGNGAADIIRTWSLPNLQRLRTCGHDDALPFLQRTTALDTLEWYFDGIGITGIHLLETLKHASLSHLRRLELDWCNTSLEDPDFNQFTQAVQLPSLSELSLNAPVLEDEPERILQLLQLIPMPNLTKLYIRCHNSTYDVGEFLPWLGSLKNPALRKVKVVIVGNTDHYWLSIRRRIRKALLRDKQSKKLKLDLSFEDEPDWDSEESPDFSNDSSDE